MFSLKTAASLAFLSAALHVVGLVLGGFSVAVVPAIGGTVLWVLVGYGLWQGRRSVGYIGFVAALMGMIAAMIQATSLPSGSLATVWWAIVATDVLIALALFGTLWRARATSQV